MSKLDIVAQPSLLDSEQRDTHRGALREHLRVATGGPSAMKRRTCILVVATSLALTIPPSLLLRADEAIA